MKPRIKESEMNVTDATTALLGLTEAVTEWAEADSDGSAEAVTAAAHAARAAGCGRGEIEATARRAVAPHGLSMEVLDLLEVA